MFNIPVGQTPIAPAPTPCYGPIDTLDPPLQHVLEASDKTATTQPLRIFLVEDSPIIRERLTESLSEPGRIEIIGHADTEASALSELRNTSWDVVVLDLQLREGNGLNVLKVLHDEYGPSAQAKNGRTWIVLTNYAFPQYRTRSLQLGADFFFDKSSEYERVRDVLNDLAAQRDDPIQQ